jgi:endoglucanase
MNVIRLPFRWERMQKTLNGDIDEQEWAYIQSLVDYVTGTHGAYAILDPHNQGQYNGVNIGMPAVPASAFADFWGKIAAMYKDNQKVIFGLMNDPNGIDSAEWRDTCNVVIAAIRATGAQNLVLVPPVQWSRVHHWSANTYGTPNSVGMLGIVDSANNFAYEVHQFLNPEGSGLTDDCVGPDVGAEFLTEFTDWCRQNGFTAILTEMGIANNDGCRVAFSNLLDWLDANNDVWRGWTYWSAGPMWAGWSYSLQPADGVDQPQLELLLPHLAAAPTPQSTNPPVDTTAPQATNTPQSTTPQANAPNTIEVPVAITTPSVITTPTRNNNNNASASDSIHGRVLISVLLALCFIILM